jgi:undecaprenyl-diphosphatase
MFDSQSSLGYGEAAVLGVVQGVTEFLPISSTAHLKIVPELLGWGDPGAEVSAVIQLGTLVAIILYFFRDLVRMTYSVFDRSRSETAAQDRRLAAGILIGTLPIVILGKLFKEHIEREFRSFWVIVAALAGFGILLWISDRAAARATKKMEQVGVREALLVGIAQAFALFPGASRSGTTMTGAFFLGIERGAAARFSFLLSIPAVGAAALYELWKERELLSHAGFGPLAFATAVAGVTGYLSLDLLLRFLRTQSAAPFVYYRVALAAVLVVLLLTGKIQALPHSHP